MRAGDFAAVGIPTLQRNGLQKAAQYCGAHRSRGTPQHHRDSGRPDQKNDQNLSAEAVMRLQACADKLEQEISEFGNPPKFPAEEGDAPDILKVSAP